MSRLLIRNVSIYEVKGPTDIYIYIPSGSAYYYCVY